MMYVALVALAAQATGTEAQVGSIPGSAAQEQAADGANVEGVQDIIVTAQRRGENLQRVPISVTAVNADVARDMGIVSTVDIPIASPAVTFAQTASGANVTIRGVGASGSPVDEPANAVYIDGVYQAAVPGLVFSLNNIDRVEVLKGPQGTLFGRNSTGGLIQIITRKPQQKPMVDVSLGYGNYDTVDAQAYVTGGIVEGLSADLSVSRQYSGKGWGQNLANGDDLYRGEALSVRSKLLWEASATTDVTLTGGYSETTPAGAQGGNILPGERTRSAGGVAGTSNVGFYDGNFDGTSINQSRQYAGSLHINHDMIWANLASITAYTDTKLLFRQDADAGPAPVSQLDIVFPVKTFSQELQLQTPAGSRITGSAGLYFFANKVALDPFTLTGYQLGAPPPAFQRIEDSARTHSYAAYGQTTIPLGDTTNLTAGLRYTLDRRRMDAQITTLSGTVIQPRRNVTERKLTWRLALDQRLGERVTVYASYNRGYKGGLFNITTPTQPTVGPSTVDAYEIGLKSQFLDNHVRLNVAAFLYNIDGIQLRSVNALGAGFLLNAASARQKGVDLDLTVQPVRNLDLTAGVSYLDGRFRRFDTAPFFSNNPAGGLIQSVGDASGLRTPYSPKWVASGSANYKVDLGGAGSLRFTGTLNYNDGYYFDPQNRVFSHRYVMVNPSVAWTTQDERVELRAWSRNLADSRYITNATSGTVGDQYYPGAPRTYGLTLRYRYE